MNNRHAMVYRRMQLINRCMQFISRKYNKSTTECKKMPTNANPLLSRSESNTFRRWEAGILRETCLFMVIRCLHRHLIAVTSVRWVCAGHLVSLPFSWQPWFVLVRLRWFQLLAVQSTRSDLFGNVVAQFSRSESRFAGICAALLLVTGTGIASMDRLPEGGTCWL